MEQIMTRIDFGLHFSVEVPDGTTMPLWLEQAKRALGTKETPGAIATETIINWWKLIGLGGIHSDEVPWCSCFVAAMLTLGGVKGCKGLRYEAAKNWLDWGMDLLGKPKFGCIAVLSRPGGFHTGFVVGVNDRDVAILGGNQGNQVEVALFRKDRILGYRWPTDVTLDFADAPQITYPKDVA
jgi:uncharacterized protein (TIGR02594 family)